MQFALETDAPRGYCEFSLAMMLMAGVDYASNGGVEVLMDKSHEK
jgi:hypothetical protein